MDPTDQPFYYCYERGVYEVAGTSQQFQSTDEFFAPLVAYDQDLIAYEQLSTRPHSYGDAGRPPVCEPVVWPVQLPSSGEVVSHPIPTNDFAVEEEPVATQVPSSGVYAPLEGKGMGIIWFPDIGPQEASPHTFKVACQSGAILDGNLERKEIKPLVLKFPADSFVKLPRKRTSPGKRKEKKQDLVGPSRKELEQAARAYRAIAPQPSARTTP